MTSAIDRDVEIGAFTLDSGEELAGVVQRVTLYSSNAEALDGGSTSLALRARSAHHDKRVRTALVTHALTGSSRVAEWWPGMIGEAALFDPREWSVVGINVLGGCYGSTGPSNTDGALSRVTVRDMVRAQALALDALGIERLDLVVGGSLGGMQALQWGIEFPERIGNAVVLGAHDHHSAMGVALNALQREALELDPRRGLRLARKIAMLTYKSEELFNERHGRRRDRHGADRFDVEGYLEHQADLFERRMDAHTYALLTHAMDAFDVRDAALTPDPEFLFVGISSDWLFRPQDVRAAAERFRARGARATYAELRSEHGHDAFLAEPRALSEIIARSAST